MDGGGDPWIVVDQVGQVSDGVGGDVVVVQDVRGGLERVAGAHDGGCMQCRSQQIGAGVGQRRVREDNAVREVVPPGRGVQDLDSRLTGVGSGGMAQVCGSRVGTCVFGQGALDDAIGQRVRG